MLTEKQITKIQEELIGGCKNIEDIMGLLGITGELTKEDLIKIEEGIFNCSSCGWWFDIGDMGGYGDYCYNCEEELEEENDENF